MNNIRTVLQSRGELSDDEHVVAIELWLGEMHGDEIKRPSVTALIVGGENYDAVAQSLETEDPLPVRAIEMDLSMEEFLLLFKRFAV